MGDPQRRVFRAWPEKVAIICTLIFVCSGSVATLVSSKVCHYYNQTPCEGDCSEREVFCDDKGGESKRQYCYSLWTNGSEGFKWMNQGCWSNDEEKCHSPKCVGAINPTPTARQENLIFCCCSGDYCNENIEYTPAPTTQPPDDVPATVLKKDSRRFTLLMSLVPIIGLAVTVVVVFALCRRHRFTYHEPLPTADPQLNQAPALPAPRKSIDVLEVRARGRFGKVYLAKLYEGQVKTVAVKEFPFQELRSWETECDIYRLAQMQSHANVLKFITAERHDEEMTLWLVTEFHERGSLYDYLKGNLITWQELLTLAESMACGLSFLHREIPPGRMGDRKPAIAHRDFKSKNVLIQTDMTVCIADFGLALKFEPGAKTCDTHGQVGTRRYMAPEVLEGAINFNQDAFLRIDMYACALVLWELMARCSAADGPVEDYRLPFEAEVGLHPSLEEMQEVVIQQRKRPIYRETWCKHLGMQSLYLTIEECWDQDAEARLSSCCVYERLTQLNSQLSLATSPVSPPPSTGGNNNLTSTGLIPMAGNGVIPMGYGMVLPPPYQPQEHPAETQVRMSDIDLENHPLPAV